MNLTQRFRNFTFNVATSLLFTILFIAVVAAVYYAMPSRFRWIVLLLASLGFYIAVEPKLFFLAIISTLWAWWSGKKLAQNGQKRWLAIGIIPLVLNLFIFKYYNFFYESVLDLLKMTGIALDSSFVRIAMPIGISYYTFKLIAYLVDIYKDKDKCEPHPGYFATYALFFPQVVCGPIQRPNDFLEQVHKTPGFDAQLFNYGFRLILLGLFKILVIANPIQIYVNKVYSTFESAPGLTLFCNAVLYSILIYCDFSGCTDIATGSCNLLGLRCKRNFNAPYFSKNIHEFWKRWHISLTSWLRDYIYIPLGGNRVGKVRQKLNILITFLVSGLWHGANWTFIFWGLIHGIWSVLAPRPPKTAPAETTHSLWQSAKAILATLCTGLGVTIAWIFFRSESIASAFRYIWRMVTKFRINLTDIQNSIVPFSGDSSSVYIFLTLTIGIVLLGIFEKKVFMQKKYEEQPFPTAWMAVFFVFIILFGKFGQSGFIYANF